MTTPPATAVLPAIPAGAPAAGTRLPPHFSGCFGCGTAHPAGLRLAVTVEEGLAVSAIFDVGELHQGAAGLAHGGLLAAALDDVLGSLLWVLGTPAVTARLETDYLLPVPVGARLHLHGACTGVDGRKIWTRGEARLGGPAGPLVLTAAALFVVVPLEHFAEHGHPDLTRRHPLEPLVYGP